MTIHRRAPASIGSRLSAIAAGTASGLRRTARTATATATGSTTEEEPLRPGRTYTFEISLTNPLYEPIQVRLGVARPRPIARNDGSSRATVDGGGGGEEGPPPFAVNLPASSFSISAYAEDWEYEDDEDTILRDDGIVDEGDEAAGGGESAGGGGGSPKKKRRAGTPGIVERRMNRTTVAMDVAIARDVVGPLRVSFLCAQLEKRIREK